MPDKIVLDSSVIAAIFFREDGVSEKAEEIVSNYDVLYTVDLAVAEVTNVAWKKIRFENEKPEIVKSGLEKCVEFITSVCEVASCCELYDTAFAIAVEKEITVYEAFFVAASRKLNAPLATTDRRLFQKVDDAILVRSAEA